MAYFTIRQCPIFYTFPMDVKEQRKLDVFLSVLESSGIGPIIASSVFGDGPNVGKKPYDPYQMFASHFPNFRQPLPFFPTTNFPSTYTAFRGFCFVKYR